MKKILIAFFALMSYSALQAQESMPTKQQSIQTKVTSWYCCPKCDCSQEMVGQCCIHDIDLIKDGNYFCETCNFQSRNVRTCPKCNIDMKQMECGTKKQPVQLKK